VLSAGSGRGLAWRKRKHQVEEQQPTHVVVAEMVGRPTTNDQNLPHRVLDQRTCLAFRSGVKKLRSGAPSRSCALLWWVVASVCCAYTHGVHWGALVRVRACARVRVAARAAPATHAPCRSTPASTWAWSPGS
jgi:hypothetical protein